MHMTDTRATEPEAGHPFRLLWLVLLIATATGALLMLPARKEAPTPPATPETSRISPAPAEHNAETASTQLLVHQAALAATAFPVETTVTERPDYVSEMEWQVLEGVAANSANPEWELGRLVAKLRFTRQLELWQEMAPHDARRNGLTLRLLDDIPARVENRDMALHDARNLQQQLVDARIADPEERAARLATEQQRLRVLITPHEATR